MYIAIDNETGGIGADKVSLLSAYFAVYDKNLNFVEELDLFLKPNDGVYRIEAGALNVNKINLVEHDKVALPYSQGGQVLFNFLKKHSNDGAIKLIPIGHNVSFDLLFIYTQLMSQNTCSQFISHRKIDTGVIAQFLKLTGFLPDDNSGGLEALAAYFNITETAKHTGKGDVETTMAILKEQVALLTTPKASVPFSGKYAPMYSMPGQGQKV